MVNEEVSKGEKKQSKIANLFKAFFSDDNDELDENTQAEVDKLNIESAASIKSIENKILSDKKKSRKTLTENLKVENEELAKQVINNTSNEKKEKSKEQDEFVK